MEGVSSCSWNRDIDDGVRLQEDAADLLESQSKNAEATAYICSDGRKSVGYLFVLVSLSIQF
jgi:hypothetical protein